MKQVLGQTLMQKKVVAQTGAHLGNVFDIDFSADGTVNFLIVKPEAGNKDLEEYYNECNLIEVPFTDVKAVGEYVVVDFPKS